MYQHWRLERLLGIARQLAEKLPHGPRREGLLDRIANHLKMIEVVNPFGRMFDDYFDPFGGPDEDEGEDDFEDK